ncbi:hypothetical protein JCM19240_6367 [Vibrio maritimus]|uniref:Transporter n=1 Tax=Vibrio maritimus TaxID=990268 RepID=A0A090SYS9_9VIBR|nr:hypothetical protein JCM19240_6367 [Vibrio maritimus]
MQKHSRKEDWIAILTGTFIVAQGIFFLQSAQLLTGGTTGLALLMSQFVPISFGTLYFALNSPFYLLAWKRFGKRFAASSAISGALVSIITDNMHRVVTLDNVNTIYCAIAGGLLMGLGMLILFRHRSTWVALTCCVCLFRTSLEYRSVKRRWQLIVPFLLHRSSLCRRRLLGFRF